MKVLVCGSRTWTAVGEIVERLTRDGEVFDETKDQGFQQKHKAQEACLAAFKKANRPVRVQKAPEEA